MYMTFLSVFISSTYKIQSRIVCISVRLLASTSYVSGIYLYLYLDLYPYLSISPTPLSRVVIFPSCFSHLSSILFVWLRILRLGEPKYCTRLVELRLELRI